MGNGGDWFDTKANSVYARSPFFVATLVTAFLDLIS